MDKIKTLLAISYLASANYNLRQKTGIKSESENHPCTARRTFKAEKSKEDMLLRYSTSSVISSLRENW